MPLKELLQPTMDEIEAIASRVWGARACLPGSSIDAVHQRAAAGADARRRRPAWGREVDAGAGLRPPCSVKHGLTSAVFSLEMSKSEIVMRLLSAEARIGSRTCAAGRMSDDDWTRMARRMTEISEAPLYIDDSPEPDAVGIRERRGGCRSATACELVIVDYLQLIVAARKVESRRWRSRSSPGRSS